MIETMIKMWDRYGFVYLQGLTGTLCLAAITVFFGTLIGMILAIMRLSRVKPFQWFVRFYIWVLRGTPILLQLYFFWIFLPRVLPVKISDSSCIIIALIINASSYVAEVIRAGIQAVDKGQTEAARSLGMTGSHTMTQIILPQAIKNSSHTSSHLAASAGIQIRMVKLYISHELPSACFSRHTNQDGEIIYFTLISHSAYGQLK